jgi:dTDP-4-dehydrorhamnose reductase
MRILVTGTQGQVARALAERGAGQDLVFGGRPELDLADPSSIDRAVEAVRPDLVISAAAYTAVDQAEDEPVMAQKVNAVAPGALARAAARVGAPVLHLSTDYVFDGTADRPYREDDPTCPVSVYGQTKLAGEQAIIASGADFAIIRTAWVYSPYGGNFIATMLRLAADRDMVRVVDDQIGCPTSALDIADTLLAIATRLKCAPGHGLNAIYHYVGAGEASWAALASEVFSASKSRGGPSADVTGIPTSEYPTKAARPANSRLSTIRIEAAFGIAPRPWRQQVVETVKRLVR